MNSTPDARVVAAIQDSCNVDAAIRPTVTALLNVPGLATQQEVLIVDAARSVIDPICANPSGSVSANTQAILAANVGKIAGLIVTLQTRQQPAASHV
jgi:hypothetical protein